MRELLVEVERNLPRLIDDPETEWNDLLVTYAPPLVERLWMQYDDEHRVFLHRIHPVEEGVALWHNHPWPGIVKVIQGTYRMKAGVWRLWHDDYTAPEAEFDMELGPGSVYEMPTQFSWHSVDPIREPVLSVMVIGEPFTVMRLEPDTKPTSKQPRLDGLTRQALLADFAGYYTHIPFG